jgi:hypothetical protein
MKKEITSIIRRLTDNITKLKYYTTDMKLVRQDSICGEQYKDCIWCQPVLWTINFVHDCIKHGMLSNAFMLVTSKTIDWQLHGKLSCAFIKLRIKYKTIAKTPITVSFTLQVTFVMKTITNLVFSTRTFPL